MAKIYKRWIDAGRMTINQVPERWREQVKLATNLRLTCN